MANLLEIVVWIDKGHRGLGSVQLLTYLFPNPPMVKTTWYTFEGSSKAASELDSATNYAADIHQCDLFWAHKQANTCRILSVIP